MLKTVSLESTILKKVLLVDDSPTILMSVKGVLERNNIQVTTANNGEEGYSSLQSQSFDLVITDLNMPGMNGIELIKKARSLPGMRFTPMLVLTTESQQSKRQEAKTAGATGWLVKPVQGEQLMQVMKKVLPGA